ncbi:MAG: diaminopimelate epimerase [Chloroflexota bacterium]
MLTKSHGLGNDYLVVDPAELPFGVTPERVRLLCDRHAGVGSDGLLVLEGRLGVRIFNPDGSEAEKSGNGLRIFARWLYDTGRVQQPTFVIETCDGSAPVEVAHVAGQGVEVSVDMGRPAFREDLRTIEIDGERLEVVGVSMGNPHCVVINQTLDISTLMRLGPRLELDPAFPNRTNVQLGRAIARNRVELLIWERGAGETQASGSSACAVVAAFHRLGLVDSDVTAAMPGGQLHVRIQERGNFILRGPVEEVAHVSLSAELIARLQALP